MPTNEPLFITIRNDDPEMLQARALAAATTSVFKAYVLRAGDHTAMRCAKLRFRDPDLSEQFAHLSKSDRKKYDEYAGVTVWEPVPKPET